MVFLIIGYILFEENHWSFVVPAKWLKLQWSEHLCKEASSGLKIRLKIGEIKIPRGKPSR